MKITESEILDEIQKCTKDINYFYQKYYIHAREKGMVIKSHPDNQDALLGLAEKTLADLADYIKPPKTLI